MTQFINNGNGPSFFQATFSSMPFLAFLNGGNDTMISANFNDTLHGGNGNDFLRGGLDNDQLFGDAGNDQLFGDSGMDSLYGGLGNDSLNGGTENDQLSGNAGRDKLSGEDGDDYLVGGLGIDTLTGGKGKDFFAFETLSQGIDRITDFNTADDTIVVSAAGFRGGLVANATISAAQFAIGPRATSASHRFTYNPANGNLFFDRDGTGAIAPVQIATLSGAPTLTHADIYANV